MAESKAIAYLVTPPTISSREGRDSVCLKGGAHHLKPSSSSTLSYRFPPSLSAGL